MPEDLASRPEMKAVQEAVALRFGPALIETAFQGDELTLKIARDELQPALEFLKSRLGFNTLDDVIGLDNSRSAPAGGKRFSVLYQLRRAPGPVRVRLAVDLAEDETVASAVPVFTSADWSEREIYDLLGIRFDGHPDLRRIYMSEDFAGHPLRKDFPLAGDDDGV
jgi:NADH-quinone oxidoreductase subunit C